MARKKSGNMTRDRGIFSETGLLQLGGAALFALHCALEDPAEFDERLFLAEGDDPAVANLLGYRSIMGVPMLREGRAIGAITVMRSTIGAFADRQIDLLKTFADQAVIAVQNAQLFKQIQEKSAQLEVASQHKSQFLASMSHELRTPLNALLGFNEMILGDIYGEVPTDMKPPLVQMQASGRHLLRLINNVLDLAKIEAGRMELALSDYSVHDPVEGVQRHGARRQALAEARRGLAGQRLDARLWQDLGRRGARQLPHLRHRRGPLERRMIPRELTPSSTPGRSPTSGCRSATPSTPAGSSRYRPRWARWPTSAPAPRRLCRTSPAPSAVR